ncbi:MAG: hypothetical protein ACHQQR_03220 [Gemmatimonadales bacterium]
MEYSPDDTARPVNVTEAVAPGARVSDDGVTLTDVELGNDPLKDTDPVLTNDTVAELPPIAAGCARIGGGLSAVSTAPGVTVKVVVAVVPSGAATVRVAVPLFTKRTRIVVERIPTLNETGTATIDGSLEVTVRRVLYDRSVETAMSSTDPCGSDAAPTVRLSSVAHACEPKMQMTTNTRATRSDRMSVA